MSDAHALQREAFSHFVAGRLDEAAAGYRAALEADPKLAIAWNGLAMVLDRQDDLDGAIEAAKQLVALEPGEALGHTSLSIFYQRKGMIAEAEDEKAIATRLAMQKS
jgi:tetratricopeptide (TPR) repeat protein